LVEDLSLNKIHLVSLEHDDVVVIGKLAGAGAQAQVIPNRQDHVLLLKTLRPLVLSSHVCVHLGERERMK